MKKCLGFLGLLWVVSSAHATTLTVTSNLDTGAGSLAEAITHFNSTSNCTGSDRIEFGSVGTITLTTALPAIACAGLTIDGTTAPDTNLGSIIAPGQTVGQPATAFAPIPRPDVAIVSTTLNDMHGAAANGISIAANNVTVKGLSIRGFDSGIETEGNFTGIVITGNYIGVVETAADIAAGDPGSSTAWSGARNNNGIRVPKIDNTLSAVGVTITNNVIAWPNARGIYIDGASGWKGTSLTSEVCCGGNGAGYNLTITGNWIERTGQQQIPGGGNYPNQGFEFTSGGGIEIEDTFQPMFTITGNRILGQPGRVPTAFSLSPKGSNGIEINNAQRVGLANQAMDGGTCTTCTISGNTITDYLHGVVSRAGSGLSATPLSSKDVLDGYSLLNNVFSGNTMGATSAGNNVTIRNNLADANFGAGLFITGGTTTVRGNTATNNAVGIMVGDPFTYIGTRTNSATGDLVERNTVTDNTKGSSGVPNAGVAVVHDTTRVVITQNSISRNSGLGIDLVPGGIGLPPALSPGVTPNDDDDADAGPNNLQNFPVFNPASGITISGGLITFKGWARPGNTLEFFIVNPDGADPTGFGEGLRYVCSANSGTTAGVQPLNPNQVNYPNGTTPPVGGQEGQDSSAAAFTVTCTVPAWLPANPIFTATATDVAQNVTSEFSFMRAVQYTPPPPANPTPVPVDTPLLLLGLSALLALLGAGAATRRR